MPIKSWWAKAQRAGLKSSDKSYIT